MATAQTAVDLELILAVDASGSVSEAEFDLQVPGLAGAFRDPDVVAAIRDAGPTGVAVALVQMVEPWSADCCGRLVGGFRWGLGRSAGSADLGSGSAYHG